MSAGWWLIVASGYLVMAIGTYFFYRARTLLRDALTITRITPAHLDRLRQAIDDYKADHAHLVGGGYEADRYSDLWLLFAAEDLLDTGDDL